MTANLITELVIQPDKLEEALDYLRKMRADVHANEPFAPFYQMYQLKDRPNEVWVMEVFENQAGLEKHLQRHDYRRGDFDKFLAKPEVLHVAEEI
jgi:quinol monooxygenase YgiN